MKERMKVVMAVLLVVVLSGCFPIFIPVDDGHHRGGGEHDRGDHHGGGHR